MATIACNGTTTTLAQNLAGEQTSESYSGGTLDSVSVTSTYDDYLRRTDLYAQYSSTPLLHHSFGYDDASRLSTVTDGTGSPAYSATYAYLANSPLVSQITFSQDSTTRMTTTRQHDYLNRLTQTQSVSSAPSVVSSSYAYNNANQRVRNTLADGSYWVYTYDALGQVVSGHKYWFDQTPVAGQQFDYAFDDIGNRTQAKAGGDENGANQRSANYSANNLNQYTSRDVPGAVDIMGISLAGNTVTVNGQTAYRKGEYFRKQLPVGNGSAPVWQSVTVHASGQTDITGHEFVPKTPEQFYYDGDGNLTNDGHWTFWWDAENHLVKLAPNTTVAPQISLQFEYDWKGRRIRKQVWPNATRSGTATNDVKFVYDGWNLIAELDALNASTLLRSYVWGADLSGTMQGAGGVGGLLFIGNFASPIGYYAPAYDGNGNVCTLISMADGTPAAQYEYGPFGEVLRATGPMAKANPFRFSTKYQDDETDLLYYGYRYYNPITGSWASRDPAEQEQGGNLYAFNCGNPITYIDPLGLYYVSSEGFAFRDPKWLSLGWQSGSGYSESAAAYYTGWGSPWLTSICNSGILGKGPDGGDYPPEKTSFVKAYIWDKCISRYRVTCRASLTGMVWGRVNAGVASYSAIGTVLGDSIRRNETFTIPIAQDGSAWVIWFQKTVTKDITVNSSRDRAYILYHVYMPIALQVKNHFRGGFAEHGEANCSIQSLGN